MSWDRLKLVTPAKGAALTLAQAKAQCLYDDTDRDDWFTETVASVLATIEGPKGIGIVLLTQGWRMSADFWPEEIIIPLGPVQSIVSIKYQDFAGVVQTLDPSLYAYDLDAEPVRIRRAFGAYWPPAIPNPGSIKVLFTAGYGDDVRTIPDDLKHAMKMTLSHFHEHREAVVGVDGRDSSAELPMGVTSILERYRVGRIA